MQIFIEVHFSKGCGYLKKHKFMFFNLLPPYVRVRVRFLTIFITVVCYRTIIKIINLTINTNLILSFNQFILLSLHVYDSYN